MHLLIFLTIRFSKLKININSIDLNILRPAIVPWGLLAHGIKPMNLTCECFFNHEYYLKNSIYSFTLNIIKYIYIWID